MSHEKLATPAQPKAGEGFLHKLFARRDEKGHADKVSGALDLEDIQGFILRSYRMPMVRHFLLEVGKPAQARELLGQFINGEESDAPQITTGQD